MGRFVRFTILLGIIWLLVAINVLQAQNWLGAANSNYAGTNGLYLNPSSIADSRYQFYLNFASFDVNLYNNYLRFDPPYRLRDAAAGAIPSKYKAWDKSYLAERLNGKTKMATITTDMRGPSYMFSLDSINSLAFTNRFRSFVQGYGISQNLARLMYNGLENADSMGLANRPLVDPHFTAPTNNYSELALTYARVLTPNVRHFMKAGITAKYLVGLASAFVQNKGFEYEVYNGDSIRLTNTTLRYGYADYQYYQEDFKFGRFITGNGLGWGAGFDIGFTYEYRPNYLDYFRKTNTKDVVDPTLNKYKVRIGAALTDLGFVRYSNSKYVRNNQIRNPTTVNWGQLNTLRVNNLAAVDSIAARVLGINSSGLAYNMLLPTNMVLSVDYKIREHVYINATWIQSLIWPYAIATRNYTNVSLTPRFESAWVDVSFPMMMAYGFRKFQVGSQLRAGFFFIGTDNLGDIVKGRSIDGFDLYAGFYIPLYKHAPQVGCLSRDDIKSQPSSSERMKNRLRKFRLAR